MSLFKLISVVTLTALFFAGCSSAQKQRKEQRDKIAQTSKMFCEFVNGEVYPDVEVQLNLEMAKRCDSDKSFTISTYKTPSENQGIVYCCALKVEAKQETKAETKPEVKQDVKPADKKAEGKE
ncbi:MAG: hypothetical protein BroJett040_22380 [Oligoflexia bacterium]|nr:MAG: hypothetical protein BroJett040_22380 [Oligoflexia bacterium]